MRKKGREAHRLLSCVEFIAHSLLANFPFHWLSPENWYLCLPPLFQGMQQDWWFKELQKTTDKMGEKKVLPVLAFQSEHSLKSAPLLIWIPPYIVTSLIHQLHKSHWSFSSQSVQFQTPEGRSFWRQFVETKLDLATFKHKIIFQKCISIDFHYVKVLLPAKTFLARY